MTQELKRSKGCEATLRPGKRETTTTCRGEGWGEEAASWSWGTRAAQRGHWGEGYLRNPDHKRNTAIAAWSRESGRNTLASPPPALQCHVCASYWCNRMKADCPGIFGNVVCNGQCPACNTEQKVRGLDWRPHRQIMSSFLLFSSREQK